jgi:hypothetical protein
MQIMQFSSRYWRQRDKENCIMATFKKRRNRDGSTVWDTTVRIIGYPSQGRTFGTKLKAELWAAKTETAAKGGTLVASRGMTFAMLLDEGLPKLINPNVAAFAYWHEQLGDMRLDKLARSPELIAPHRDRLLGEQCRGHNHLTSKPRSSATVRNYLIELGRLFALAVKEMRVMETNPCNAVTKPAASNKVVRFLSDDERTALLTACRKSESKDLYAFVLFALTAGPRKAKSRRCSGRRLISSAGGRFSPRPKMAIVAACR